MSYDEINIFKNEIFPQTFIDPFPGLCLPLNRKPTLLLLTSNNFKHSDTEHKTKLRNDY